MALHGPPPGLFERLDLRKGDCVSVIGGGGKTTVALALAAEARERGYSVVMTTTTRMWPSPDMALVLGTQAACLTASLQRLERGGIVMIGRTTGADGKVQGFAPELVCELVEARLADLIICEADGSAGRPLKVHAGHEPVIPTCARIVLVVAGMDAMGSPISAASIHRLGPFLALTGALPGEPVEARHVVCALLRAADRVPSRARLVFVLNKADDAEAINCADDVRARLLESRPMADCILTREGQALPLPEVRSIAGLVASPDP